MSRLMVPTPSWSASGYDATIYPASALALDIAPELAQQEPLSVLDGYDAVASLLERAVGKVDPLFQYVVRQDIDGQPKHADRWVSVIVGDPSSPLMYSVGQPWGPDPQRLAHIHKVWADTGVLGKLDGGQQFLRHRRLTAAQASALQSRGYVGCVCHLPNRLYRRYLYEMTDVAWKPADEVLTPIGKVP